MKIKGDGKVIYIDPWKLKDAEPADVVLITHEHYDHCSPADVKKVSKADTTIVATADSAAKLKGDVMVVKPGDAVEVDGVKIEITPAYNTNKSFHPKSSRWIGFVVTIGGKSIYHAGDTDHISEMDDLKVDVALVPISGTYVMTAEEAAEAVNRMKPKIAVPIHYGDIVGTKADAERFKKLVSKGIEVRIL
ncbi:MAG: Zn-dependent hydrolase [Planctomycetes bacterium RIFCSPHIGHO2_02_FULL_50_42]|nr:MAG: Zn-dependent hydrolase [Planctomycetes bacterium RIFCSPHIGHO2_02_FULL_50_42]OHB92426.1 MAG: Zn-dependent hydrolase [Planctomycetes bacterium RIFCSPHIGHO2_12_FULL_51_37]OHB96693.1 MAG: Zn-dependent hydrolase [Planctomycetes bacterium RIFCSPLOWO2_02_FULL_50_16]HCN18788.1 Zn-dependent hydrolase [Planctomycetia bacterium]